MKFEVIARGTGFRPLRGNSDLFGVILSFLGAADLCRLSAVCRHLHEDSTNSYLWKTVMSSDFTDIDFDGVSLNKAAYIKHYTGLIQRIERAKTEKHQSMNDLRKEQRIDSLEKFLDMTQMRIMVALPPIASFFTLLLLALRFDGDESISSWVCFFPVLLVLMYVLINIAVANVIYSNQFSQMSIMRGIWPQMSGPIRYIYTEMLSQRPIGARITIGLIFAAIMEAFLLSAKLSGGRDSLINTSISWSLVFVPIWCLFLAFAMSPFLSHYREIGFYYVNMFFFWLPSFIFFVSLAIKLTGQDNKSKNGEITLALIFLPLWLIEGVLMLATLCFLIHGVYRYFKGLLDNIEEHTSKAVYQCMFAFIY